MKKKRQRICHSAAAAAAAVAAATGTLVSFITTLFFFCAFFLLVPATGESGCKERQTSFPEINTTTCFQPAAFLSGDRCFPIHSFHTVIFLLLFSLTVPAAVLHYCPPVQNAPFILLFCCCGELVSEHNLLFGSVFSLLLPTPSS